MTKETSGSQENVRATARCRVCLKEIHAGEARATVHYRGGHYVVCCPSCAREFKAAPHQYVCEE